MADYALITGASSGIGYELAKVFAHRGYDLIVVARRDEELRKLREEIGREEPEREVHILAFDLGRPGAAGELFEKLTKRNPSVSVLVNNAGVGAYGTFADVPWEKHRAVIQLNIEALTHLTHLYAPLLADAGRGGILNVASTAAFQAGPLMSVYYASKAYVLSFSEALANELKSNGVKVTALCPGPTESEFAQAAEMEESRLFHGQKLPTSREVAEFGYEALQAGKRVAIHGTANRLGAGAVRFLPRRWAAAIARKIQERRN